MIVDTGYYIFSFLITLISFVIRDFVVPLFVWRKYLKGKSLGYKFWFCVITQAALLINLVLLLGFFNICNRWTILLCLFLIYGLISWNFSDKNIFRRMKHFLHEFRLAGKEDKLLRYLGLNVTNGLKTILKSVRGSFNGRGFRKHFLQGIGLATIVVYNLWFLTYNTMRYHSFQFSDIPVHQSWIYALEKGTLFADGIYPFGMHAMVYIIRIIFGINLRTILLYAGVYQTILLVIGLYILAGKLFYAKYTPLTVVTVFSLMLNQDRYAGSLPQEAGMFAIVGVAYFMMSVLHEEREHFVIEGDSGLRRAFRFRPYMNRRYMNTNALLLMLCVALVISYHFYTAIGAICFVIAIGMSYLPRILKKQYFIPLLSCGILGAMIAVIPFGACLAKGIPFQASMAWATSVIAGEQWQGNDQDYISQLADEKQLDLPDSTGADREEGEDVKTRIQSMSPQEFLRYYFRTIFDFTSNKMFKESVSWVMFACLLAGFLLGLLMHLKGKLRNIGRDYLAIIGYMFLLFTLGCAKPLGIVELVEMARISTFTEPFIGFVFMLPVDFAFRILGVWKNRYYQSFLKLLSAAVCIGAVVVIVVAGWYHNYFKVYQAYYNEAEYVLRKIKQSYDKHTYTIVSPMEEYYDVLDYGYHMQLSEFVNMVNGNQDEFRFPTGYVFFFIEKRVLKDYFYGSVYVNLEYAAKDFTYKADTLDYFYQRAIIESQAYYWAKEFEKMYPHEFRVFFEDDIYVVYLLEQNTYAPFSLQFDYMAPYQAEIEANGWSN